MADSRKLLLCLPATVVTTTRNPRQPILVCANAITREGMLRREMMIHQQNESKWVMLGRHQQKPARATHKNEQRNTCHGTLFQIIKVKTSTLLAYQPLVAHHRRSLLITSHRKKP
jgi:hypothetical protein